MRPRKRCCRVLTNRKKWCTRWRPPVRYLERMRRQLRAMKLNTATRALLFVAASLAISICVAHASDSRKEARIDIAPGGTVNIVNGSGSVALHSGTGHQLLVAYTVHSTKVEVDQSTSDNKQRVELLTHALPGEKPTADEAKVDYDVTVPAGVSVNVSTTSAPITAEGISSEIDLSSETGQVTVGNIDYEGDCSGGGSYILTTHSGAIDVTLPATASVDLTARSTTGTVENDFPLQQKPHTSFVPQQGRSFAGTSNSGSSSVELQSFSGKIRVKKQ